MRITYGPWGETLGELADAARAAEDAGAEVLWLPELHRGATTSAAAVAGATRTARVGTAIALAFTRSPMVTALEALDLDEMSNGRFVLGLGTGVRRLNEDWHHAQWGQPVAHLREVVRNIRAFWAGCTSGEPIDLDGDHEPMHIRGYRRPYPVLRTDIPIYLAAMGPALTRLSGEIADGWISHELSSAAHLRAQILPEIMAGIARVEGRTRRDVDVVTSACCSVDADPAVARRRAAGMVGFYASVKTYADFFAFHDLTAEQDAVIEVFRGGRGAGALADAVPDRMVDTLTLSGTRDQVLERFAAYEGVADSIKLTPPTHGLSAAETRAAQKEVIALIADLTGQSRIGGQPMRPLEDVRVVAVEQYGAGPFGSVHLADLGAEIIKIEDPRVGGDVGRYVPPYAEGEDSLFFEAFNRNKSSLSLDLATTAGRSVFEDLVKVSDAVYSNLRGDVPAKIKITYDDLKHLNPAIVCCSLTGFGMTGPRASEPGYDYVLQALGGWMELTGDPDGPPSKSGLSMVDYSGGFVAAISLLAGIHAARRDGIGMDCDVSLYDTAIGMLTYPATWHLNAGFQPTRMRRSAHPSLVPFQAFEAKDGWLVIGCAKEKFWQRLTVVIERPEWATDPRFETFADRDRNRDVLLPLLEEIIAQRTVAEWLEPLRAASIPNAPINDVAAALTEPHTIARDLVVETEHPRYGTVRQVASPVRVGSEPPAYRRAPLRNEDAGRILGEMLGYGAAAVTDLTDRGAFG